MRLPRLRRRRPRPSPVHIGATTGYGAELHAVGEMQVCDELATEVERWLHLHTALNHVEAELSAGLDALYARVLDQLGVTAADVAGADNWAGVRELVAACPA